MYNIENLEVERTGTTFTVTDVQGRSFKIDAITAEPDEDWFCSYELIKRIIEVVQADHKFEELSVNNTGK